MSAGKRNVGDERILIQAGASFDTANNHGLPALELSKLCADHNMYELLRNT
jgi:hypothetical protein